MSETNTKEAKLRALELLAPVGGKKRLIWNLDGVELKDVPPENIEGHKDPVTFFTEFDLGIPAAHRDAFYGQFMEMKESGMLGIGGEEIRTVSHIPAPTQALTALALGGGITDGRWPERGENGKLQAVKVTENIKDTAKLISRLSTPAIHALIYQAIEAFLGDWNPSTGEMGTPAPEAEVVGDAGKSPTSSDAS